MDSGLLAWTKFSEDAKDKIVAEKDLKKRFTWGTRRLDITFAIIKRTDLIVIGAKRSNGKTIFAFDMAQKNANLGHKVLYISLEMTADDIISDFARKYAGWTIEEEYDYKVPETKQQAYERRVQEIKNIKNLFFEGIRRGDNLKWKNILEIINKYKDVDMVFIDNLDRIGAEEKENNNDKQKRIVDSMMGFTVERKVPIVLIHHHRKTSEGKDFGMDELAGSGKIADGADRVLKISYDAKPDMTYPEKYKTKLFLQKARGYNSCSAEIYFIRGTFMDEAPPEGQYFGVYGREIGKSEIVVDNEIPLPTLFDTGKSP